MEDGVRDARPTFLVVEAGTCRCALPIDRVIETLRPLATRPLAGAPDFVAGLSVVRGEPVPVVDLAAFVGAPALPATRFVLVRSGARRLALAVASVLGLRSIAPGTLQEAPPLLSRARAEAVATLGVLDRDLLLSLSTAHVLSEAEWAIVERGATP